MNNFSMTLDPKRYDIAVQTGRLELVGNTERFVYGLAEMRGTVTDVTLYSADGRRFSAEFESAEETGEKIVIRWQKTGGKNDKR
jgi:hypothetical protein